MFDAHPPVYAKNVGRFIIIVRSLIFSSHVRNKKSQKYWVHLAYCVFSCSNINVFGVKLRKTHFRFLFLAPKTLYLNGPITVKNRDMTKERERARNDRTTQTTQSPLGVILNRGASLLIRQLQANKR